MPARGSIADRLPKIIGLSVDPVDHHGKWAEDIKETQDFAPNFPMIGDPDLKVSKLYGMLPASVSGTSEGRTPADNKPSATSSSSVGIEEAEHR